MKVGKGDKTVTAHGAEWGPLACTLHRGEVELEPADGDKEAVLSEATGHDPECAACLLTSRETLNHAKRAVAEGDTHEERAAAFGEYVKSLGRDR